MAFTNVSIKGPEGWLTDRPTAMKAVINSAGNSVDVFFNGYSNDSIRRLAAGENTELFNEVQTEFTVYKITLSPTGIYIGTTEGGPGVRFTIT